MDDENAIATSVATRQGEGAHKAATILLAMGKPMATRLLRHFDPDEMREVVRSAARLGSVPMTQLELLVEEFSIDFSTGANLQGDADLARDMLSEAVSPQVASQILADAFGGSEIDIWEALSDVPEAVFSAYLKNERTPATTHILSKLPSSMAGKLIALLQTALPGAEPNLLIEAKDDRDEFFHAIAARKDKSPQRHLERMVDFDEEQAAAVLKQWIRQGAKA